MDNIKSSDTIQTEERKVKNMKISLALTNLRKNYPGQLDLTYDDEGDNVYTAWTNKTPIEVMEEAKSRLESAYLTMKSLIEYCMRDYNASGLIPINSRDKIDAEDMMLLQWLQNEICKEVNAKSAILDLLLGEQKEQINENDLISTNEGINIAEIIQKERSMDDKVNEWFKYNTLTNKLSRKGLTSAVRGKNLASDKPSFLKKISTLMKKHCE